MSLLSFIRNRLVDRHDDGSVDASHAVIEESKQARMQMTEQMKQFRHDAFQMSVEQERIRSDLMIRKAGPDFLDDALTNRKGPS